MAGRADSIEGAIASSIYDDDRDAIEQLQARIERLEAERARVKACNVAIRKHGLPALLQPAPPFALTDAEKHELLTLARLCPYHQVETKGFPAYHLQNLGGNLSRQRARLKDLSGTPAAAPVEDAPTATARAGLRIVASMTTPSRPGKQPRPVWNVAGNLAFWRPMLTDVGGSWYRGVFSFWDDPTDAIEAACLEAEFLEHQKADPHCTCPDCAIAKLASPIGEVAHEIAQAEADAPPLADAPFTLAPVLARGGGKQGGLF
jgi:hypothetical protein